jgi:hypothetical protein
VNDKEEEGYGEERGRCKGDTMYVQRGAYEYIKK